MHHKEQSFTPGSQPPGSRSREFQASTGRLRVSGLFLSDPRYACDKIQQVFSPLRPGLSVQSFRTEHCCVVAAFPNPRQQGEPSFLLGKWLETSPALHQRPWEKPKTSKGKRPAFLARCQPGSFGLSGAFCRRSPMFRFPARCGAAAAREASGARCCSAGTRVSVRGWRPRTLPGCPDLRRRALPSSDQSERRNAARARRSPVAAGPRKGLRAEGALAGKALGFFLCLPPLGLCDFPLGPGLIDRYMEGWKMGG